MDLKEKLYYSIAEVASRLGLKEYVLRYWEKEFDQLNPKRNARKRLYTKLDIEIASKIQYLLHKKGMTIKGARACMSSKTKNEYEKVSKKNILEQLKSLRDFLSKFAE